MKIGIDMGHALVGATGAVGVKKEVEMNRLAGNRLIEMLKEKGHEVINCTIDNESNANNQLSRIVSKANAQSLDLFVSLHLNAYNSSSANGVETYTVNTTTKAYSYAKNIQKELVNNVGWYNRGNKTANYYVLKNTSAPALLVELGFCTNQGDMDKWNTEKIAKSLFKGITGQDYVVTVTSQPSGQTRYFRVVVGSYTDRANADKVLADAKNKGFNGAFIDVFYK